MDDRQLTTVATRHARGFHVAACVLGALLGVGSACAQSDSAWTVTPGLGLVKLFPGEEIANGQYSYPASYRFSATGVEFRVRGTHPAVRNMAFTFGAGATWFTDASSPVVYTTSSPNASGIGQTMKHESFTVFPVSVGAEVVFPGVRQDKVFVFAGIEGSLNFIDGNVEVARQAQLGYALKAGFAVKVFEFGVRYTRFSDLSNLGVVIGLRFASFTIN